MTTGQSGPAQTEEAVPEAGAVDVAGVTGADVVTTPADVDFEPTGTLEATHMGPGQTGAED
jgi:hypothetical protein